jgi:hypothetical protein
MLPAVAKAGGEFVERRRGDVWDLLSKRQGLDDKLDERRILPATVVSTTWRDDQFQLLADPDAADRKLG